jgi:hypothetical protein
MRIARHTHVDGMTRGCAYINAFKTTPVYRNAELQRQPFACCCSMHARYARDAP